MIVEIEKARIECVETSQDGSFGRFVIEPLERGFGHTLGNSMRRVLLSSLPAWPFLLYTSKVCSMNSPRSRASRKMLRKSS